MTFRSDLWEAAEALDDVLVLAVQGGYMVRPGSTETVQRFKDVLANAPSPSAEALAEKITNAWVQAWTDYDDQRSARSQEVFGHPGAHIASIEYPKLGDVARRVLDEEGV